jgi:hypothetical protein
MFYYAALERFAQRLIHRALLARRAAATIVAPIGAI